MLKLIRFQSVNYLKYFLPLTLVLIYYFTEYYQRGRTPLFAFLCFWTFLLVSGSISTCEGYEEKYKGYRILGAMPLTDREIVTAKFLLVLGAVVLATGLNIALLLVNSHSPDRSGILVMIGMIWGLATLIYGGLIYIGIFRFGFTRMTTIFWTVFLIIVVALIFLLSDVIMPVLKRFVPVIRAIAGSGLWILILVPGLLLYYWLFRVAVRVKENSEEV